MVRIAGNQSNTDRDDLDDYPTDGRWVAVLMRHITLDGTIWEPAAGSGSMVQVLQEAGLTVRATDIRGGVDFLTCNDRADTIVTNPPYRLLDQFVHHALSRATKRVCMLMPIGSLGGQRRRADLWEPHPPSMVIVVVNRMKVHDKPSQFNHIWSVWEKPLESPTRLIWDVA